MQVQCLCWEDPLEEEIATHSSILAWEIPWTEEPGGLQVGYSNESDTTEWLNNDNTNNLSLTQFSNLLIFIALLVQAQWCFVCLFFCKWNRTFSLVSSQSLFSVPQLSAYMKFYRNFILILSWWNPSVSSHCHLDKLQVLSRIALENFISASQIRCLLKHFLSSFYVTGIPNCCIYLNMRQNFIHPLCSS